MHERPQAALFSALRELGYRIDSPNDMLPALVYGTGPQAGECRVSIEESSQFASALILCSLKARWSVKVIGENAEESPYVKLSDMLLATFPLGGGVFEIEPDASSGSYFWAAKGFIPVLEGPKKPDITTERGYRKVLFRVAHWPSSGWQMDEPFPQVLVASDPFCLNPDLLGKSDTTQLPAEAVGPLEVSRARHLGDSIMTAIAMAPLLREPLRFSDLGRMRLQECERVVALRTELTKCGAKVIEKDDTLTVYPSELHGAEIETYNDHRMAMCFAILGLKVPGIKIKNPACVKKTFPNFFQKLAGAPPRGLGAAILDGKTGRKLGLEELFAE